MQIGRCSIALLIVLSGSTGCGPLPDPRAVYSGDLQSPVFLGARALSPTSIEIAFHEPIRVNAEEYSCTPEATITSVSADDTVVTVDLAEPMVAGTEYLLVGGARDASDNSMKFITKLFGFNPDVPRLRINEFTTRGSGNHPDAVELRVESDGNLAGVSVYDGTPNSWTERKILPSVQVTAGAYVVVHFRPQGTTEEVDETANPQESGGLDANESAWDYWVLGGNGLPGNNGAITVCASPGGDILDAVLYSNRTSSSDERYSGFGSRRVLEQAEFLVERGAWTAEDAQVRPEDAVNPDDSTGTRSICRRAGEDTNARGDWYIVPTRGASFGAANTDEEYER